MELVGKKVLVRGVNSGVYYGTLVSIKGQEVLMENVRNIWHWIEATCLSQIANKGVRGDKIGPVVASMLFKDICQILPLTDKAVNTLDKVEPWVY